MNNMMFNSLAQQQQNRNKNNNNNYNNVNNNGLYDSNMRAPSQMGRDNVNKQQFQFKNPKMPYSMHPSSLFSMAMYDLDNGLPTTSQQFDQQVSHHQNVNNNNGNNPIMNQQLQNSFSQAAANAAFHPVDEYKDLSLKEILDLSEDFLFDDNAGCNNDDFQQQQQQAFIQQQQSQQNNLFGSSFLDPTPLPPNTQAGNNGGFTISSFNGNNNVNNNNNNFEGMMQQFNLQQQGLALSMNNNVNNNNNNMFDEATLGYDSLDFNPKKRRNNVLQDATAVLPVSSGVRSFADDLDQAYLNNQNQAANDDEANRFRPYQAGQWAEKYDELCVYRKSMGHCLVPHTFSENLPLARWVKRQRYQYKLMKEGKSSTMTEERVTALESIGFIWDSQGAAWHDRLHELETFRRVYLHCNVPSNFSENPQLATWVKCQRRQYKLYTEGKQSNMTPERIDQLEKLGFEWELRTYKKQRSE